MMSYFQILKKEDLKYLKLVTVLSGGEVVGENSEQWKSTGS